MTSLCAFSTNANKPLFQQQNAFLIKENLNSGVKIFKFDAALQLLKTSDENKFKIKFS